MKTKLPQPDVTSLMRCFRSAIAAKLLLTALEANLFTWLTTPRTSAAIADKFNWNLAAVTKYCEILSYLGLVTIEGEKVQNTHGTDKLLNKESQGNVIAYICESCRWCLEPLDDLPRILRDGPVLSKADTDPESLWEDIIACGAGMVFADSGQTVANCLAALPGSENFRRMLDLGGGHGGYAVRAAETMPRLEVDVLDFPAVLQATERYRKKGPASARVRALPANYVNDAIAPGYDVVFASDTLNFTLPGKTTRQVMDKIHAALKPGGYCVSVHDGPGEKSITPEWPFECHVCDLVTGSPMGMPLNFISDTMLASGFRHVRTELIHLNGSFRTLDVARK